MRYLGSLSYQHRTAHERLSRACAIDYNLEMALVAELLEGDRHGEIIGVGRLVRDTEFNSGEFALVVADNFQRRGVGAELLSRLVHVAREEKLETIEGWIDPSNMAMQSVSRKLGFEIQFNQREELVHAALSLSQN